MALASIFGAAAAFAGGVLAHSEEDYDHMGALGVMWPPDRAWSRADARTAPCGNVDGVVNRTEFPLSTRLATPCDLNRARLTGFLVGGSLEFEQTDVVYDLEVYVSLSEGLSLSPLRNRDWDRDLHQTDPESNEDFELVSFGPIPSLDFAHVCLPAPDLPAATADQNATLQFRYVAGYHAHKRHPSTNETFYLCSDITLVPPTFVSQDEMPCFNISSDRIGGHTHDGHEHEGEHVGQNDKARGGGLSGGAIAGIVVGCLAGVALIAGAAWFLWRRRAAREEEAGRLAADEKLGGSGSRRGSGQGSEGSVSAA